MSSLTDWIRDVETAVVEVDDTTAAVPDAADVDVVVRHVRRRRGWAAVAAACVVGCGVTAWVALHRPADAKPPGSRSAGPVASRPPGFVTYTDAAKHYRISYPGRWRRTTDAERGLVLHVGGRDAVSVREFHLTAPVDTGNVADMRAVTDAILSAPSAHLSVLESQVVRIGRLSGLYYLYYFPAGEQRGVHAHYFLFSGKRMFTLVFQALPVADFQALAKTFDAVSGSFAVTAGT
jgi:hypothetical protein